MNIFSPQTRYCPNCGKQTKDTSLSMHYVLSMMCSERCRQEWEMKYARMILNKEEPNPA